MSTPVQTSTPVPHVHTLHDLYSKCIHCGLCLNHCPTYRVLGTEMDSPRGRIYQVLAVDEGRLPVGDSFVTHIDRCLGCRACESACPSGVQYGHLLEHTRTRIERDYRRPWLARVLRDHFYRVLRNPARLSQQAKLLRIYQRSGLQSAVRASGVLKLLGLAEIEALSPRIDEDFFYSEFGMFFPAVGERRARVALLAGCVASVAFSELNRATVRVLNQNGVDVFIPKLQRCCGALHAHAGLRDDARHLARKNIEVMLKDEFDAVVTNAAGCGATLKQYGELLGDDPEFAERAQQFAAKVRDVTEFLYGLGLRVPAKKMTGRITYQDPCHLAHGQRVRSAPRELLKALGAELVEMPHADACCGSAGTYNVVQNALSMKILAEKMNEVEQTSANIIATANVGCMLQLRAGVQQRGIKTPVKHVVELLDEAY